MRIPWDEIEVVPGHAGMVCWTPGVPAEPLWPGRTEDFDLIVITGGDGWIALDGVRARLAAGSVLWLKPGRTYPAGQDPANPLAMSYIHFDLRRADGQALPGTCSLPPDLLDPPDPLFAETVCRRVVELLWSRNWDNVGPRRPRPGRTPRNSVRGTAATAERGVVQAAATLLKGLLMELDAAALPGLDGGHSFPPGAAPARRRLVTQALHAMQRRADGRVRIKELAAAAGLSPDHFTRLFRSVTGRTPRDIAGELRLERVKPLLSATRLPLKEIAAQTGFCHVFHLARQFKARVGMTPRQFRDRRQTIGSHGSAASASRPA